MDDHLNLEDGGDLPPPYSPSVNPTNAAQRADGRSYSSSLFSSHVAGLRDQISASQAARVSARDDHDSCILSLIVPYVEDFLSSISEVHPTPRLSEATLVPDAAIGEDWQFNDEDEKREGEFRRLIRVRDTKKKDGNSSSRSEKGSDGTGSRPSPSLWWESESTARRLAKHLQPERPAGPKSVQTPDNGRTNRNKKSGIWGLFRKSDEAVRPAVPAAEEPEDGVSMTARAEEVTFRRENELGLWETMTGWGIVLPADIQYDVLVTGSSGHLGHALMMTLPSLGLTPIGIDILASPTTTCVGSVTDQALIASILQKHPIKHIVHTATLHKPHVESHSKGDFVQTNIAGTLALLEEATKLGDQLESFIFFSTTSAFGAALSPKPGSPAAWIDEEVVPIPKNIYGVTKVAAEDICRLFHMQHKLPVLVLRTSRFFPEQDDDEDRRNSMGDDNLKVLEMAYRRCDIKDIVSATVCAMSKAKRIGWSKYIISAPPPFSNDPETLAALDRNPEAVFNKAVPTAAAVFRDKEWKYLDRLDRVYDSSKAVRELGWQPEYTFAKIMEKLARGEDWRSELVDKVGMKGYHVVSHGVYTK
ncbi:nad-dependent epimerase dehydratase family [Trichoderma arundinaceum]|uniref:Nad-dependent epimerase dehydratase family n=1 Tax=Trichoderma arundinaceum TaxID=490622 RepID=A0A395NZD0_TRIAR|nr:nad-dependent epimerase dehydratase family [Trichoderma arundinaceum]